MSSYLLVDANNLAARCHHQPGLAQLVADDGTKTGAIYGFLKGLSWAMHKTGTPVSNTVLVWDGGHCPVRKALYPDYKEGRKMNTPATPQEREDVESYRFQLDALYELLGHREFRQVKVGGVEADDLISIFATTLRRDGSVVFSGDQDLWQLWGPGINVWDPKRDTYIAAADFQTKFGVDHTDFVLWKALVGDSSDNIKGVPQVGPKRARVVVRYLQINRLKNREHEVQIRHSYRGQERPWDVEGKIAKYVDLVLKNIDIVQRNVQLMLLPRTVEDSYMTLDQAEEAFVQFMEPGKRNTAMFFAGLDKFNIDANTVVSW